MGVFISNGGLPIIPVANVLHYVLTSGTTISTGSGHVDPTNCRFVRICICLTTTGHTGVTAGSMTVNIGANSFGLAVPSSVGANDFVCSANIDVALNRMINTADVSGISGYQLGAALPIFGPISQGNLDVSLGADISVTGSVTNCTIGTLAINVLAFYDA